MPSIILIEPDSDLSENIIELLKLDGIQAVAATDGDQALTAPAQGAIYAMVCCETPNDLAVLELEDGLKVPVILFKDAVRIPDLLELMKDVSF